MAQALPLPEQIGRYQIVAEIGRGSMGRVYVANDPVIERRVALKVMAPRLEFNSEEWEEMQERFLLEARAAGRLKHPGVVTVFDADRDRESSIAYIAMELIEGQSLQDLISSSAPLDPKQALPIIEQVALALHAAHDQNLVHRDVKPANILIDGSGSAKLTDFGITKFRTHTLTAAGTVLGSPSYMSPEQVRGDEIDGRADLFSLGVVLFECLTGVLPFAGDSIATVTYKILELDPLAEDRIGSSLSPQTIEVVKRAIEKDPRKRFQSGYEFAQALRAARSDSPAPRGPRGTQLLAAGSAGQAQSEMTSPPPGSSPSSSVSSRYLGWLLIAVVALSLAVGIPAYRTHSPATDASMESVADSTPIMPTSQEATRPRSVAVESGPDMPSAADLGSESPVAIADSSLSIRYKNRLKEGRISIWVDQDHVWSRVLSNSGGILKRTTGNQIAAQIPVAAGKHTIEVRITGAERKVDVARRIVGVFQPDAERTLQISLIPRIKTMKLSWKE